ncbi:MAG TPA: hypothetical protein VEC18_11590, partial [Myxococcota bacterium]|nr:hypothetical protein [Myxococcota bacterium]
MPPHSPKPEPRRAPRGYSDTDPARPPRRPPLRDLKPRARFSLAYYLALIGGMLALQWIFFSGIDAPEMPYSEFRAAVEAGR